MNKSEAIKTRTIQFVFSDESRDTYGTVLSADKWVLDRFNRIGVAFYNHNGRSSDPDQVIGTGRAWVEDKKLVGSIRFETGDINPTAEKIFQKVLSGTIRTVSVGFMPLERGRFGEGDEALGGKKETYYYGRCELMEISVTPMPANKNALVRSVGIDPIAEQIESMCLECDIRQMEEVQDDNDTTKENDYLIERARAMDMLACSTIALI